MAAAARIEFFRRFAPGIVLLLASYFLLTAFRDFRDNYMVDVLESLGYSYATQGATISRMELCVAVLVLAVMASLSWIRDNRLGLVVVFGVMISGLAMLVVATVLLKRESIDGFWWMACLGVGSYLAYVPYNSILCDRLLASTRTVGTAVFTIYVADATGYTGSVFVQLFKDLALGDASRLEYMVQLSYVTGIGAAVCLAASCWCFLREIETSGASTLAPHQAMSPLPPLEIERDM